MNKSPTELKKGTNYLIHKTENGKLSHRESAKGLINKNSHSLETETFESENIKKTIKKLIDILGNF